jgi:hypothetical protein
LRARIAFRALIGAGLLLAWVGLLLPWERWRAETTGLDGSVDGFDASRAFWIILAVVTVIAAVALWRHWRWAFVALALAALPLVWLVVRAMGASVEATSAFVAVGPGAGAILSLIGAVALIAAVIVALRPPALQLAAGLAVFALVTGGAAAWPQEDGRPGDGAIADVVDDSGRTMAFQGETLYIVRGGQLFAWPAPGREYGALGVWSSEWSSDDPLFNDFRVNGLAFAGATAYVALGLLDRLVSLTPAGERRTLVARPPVRDEPALPRGTQEVEDFVAGPVAAGPDGSVYVVQGNAVARWRDGRLQTLPPRFGGVEAVATDARGALYVADTANGRVHRVDPDGGVETVVGTEAEPRCVQRGLDDPLALDPRRCTAVDRVAVDRAGNLYLALKNVGMIAGLTPEGRMGVVAGTGPKGFGDGDGRAARARLGVVDALAVGADGDLYVSESDPLARVRRIADPAGTLASEPPEPEPPEPAAACAEIAALSVAAAGGNAAALERALNALADAAPQDIADDVDAIAAGAADLDDLRFEIDAAMKPAEPGVSLGEYAELECGLAGGFDVPVDEANEFCVAYARYLDRGDLVEAGADPPPALEDVLDAAPEFLAEAGRDALRDLENAAGRAVPEAEAELLLADIEAIDAVASAMCVAR